MYVFINDKPSTFFTSEKEVKILDENKNRFYLHPNNEKKLNFNLPIGKYFTRNKIYRRKDFVPYPNSYKWHSKDFIDSFTFKKCKNKNKATIFPNQKYVFIDEKIYDSKFKPLLCFVIGHELSHCFPEGANLKCNCNEINWCDINSANRMLDIGYNPSQIKIATKLLLADGIRSECIQNSMQGNNFKR